MLLRPFLPHVALALLILSTATRSPLAQVVRRPQDPVTMDPTQVDTAYPPSTEELDFESSGARLNGFLYLANGGRVHPTVVLLHGLPGNERNLDLAQALRRAGMNVLFFSYRGDWGSGGAFSFAHALEDVAAAVQFVRSDSSVKAYRVDPHRVILLGHSLGGWLALMGTAADSSITCAVALDFWNVGADGRLMRKNRQMDSSFTLYTDWLTAAGGPLHADSGHVLTAEIEENADLWDLDRYATTLRSRSILIISTMANAAHPPLVAALQAAQARNVTAFQRQTDHGFSTQRIWLARTVISWLHTHCGS